MQDTTNIYYICVYACTHIHKTHTYVLYTHCGIFIKLSFWWNLCIPSALEFQKSTNCSTTKWKSKPSLSYSAVCGSGIKLCPCCHPPVGGARGCWRKPEGRQPSYLLSVPGSRTDAVAFEPELSRSFESPVVSILYEPLTIPSLPPLKSPNWQHTSWVLSLSIFVNNSKLLVSV